MNGAGDITRLFLCPREERDESRDNIPKRGRDGTFWKKAGQERDRFGFEEK
jgi:hypothetical protein